MTLEELEEYFSLGHETRSFEVKGPGELTDKQYCATVARATMAMGNLRDGGLVCLGVDDADLRAMLPGLSADQLKQWSNYDAVNVALARYSDPPVSFALRTQRLSNGADVVVLEVDEFDEVPHVCKKSYPDAVQDGMAYVRPRGMPRSLPVPSSLEMRELLDIATDKGVRRFVRRAGSAGVSLTSASSPEQISETAFRSEAQAAWAATAPTLEAIAKLGFTDIAIHPSVFTPNALSPETLEFFVASNTVRMRGWPVPYLDSQTPIKRYATWIGQDIEPRVVPHLEAWRMTTSGQFLHRRVLATDLRQSAELAPTHADATGSVAVWDLLLYLVEVAEFGARMAQALGIESLVFEVSLNGVAGRELVSGDWSRRSYEARMVSADQLVSHALVPSTRLITDARQVGVELVQTLLRQFGLDVADQLLLDWQDEIFGDR